MESDGAPFTPSLCQCSILLVFKATATQIREKLEQTLESLRIELGSFSTEGSALTNYATHLLHSPEHMSLKYLPWAFDEESKRPV